MPDMPEAPPDLLVDLSNVCRDKDLGGRADASWDRYGLVLAAWREQINRDSRVLAVADDNLFRLLRTMQDKAAFVAGQGRGEVITAPDADPVILDMARETGAAVLSRDGYVGHRRKHDWIQGDAEHFWSWRALSDGVRIQRREMRVRSEYTLTKAAERDERKAKNLLQSDGVPLLERVWACRRPTCPRAAEDPLTVPPLLWHGRPLCPDCRFEVEDLGERDAGRQMKVKVGDDEVTRFSVFERQIITIGRNVGDACVDLTPAHPRAQAVSRRHLTLELRGGQVVATDLGSSNGTRMQRWDPQRGTWLAGEPMTEGKPTTLLPRDRLLLGEAVHLEQSAREYVVAGAAT